MSYEEYRETYGVDNTRSHSDSIKSINTNDARPRVFFMGAQRSGKSSIQHVVFHKMSPHETLFLEATSKVRVTDIANSALFNLQLVDFPGGYVFPGEDELDSHQLFSACGALLLVVDATESTNDTEDIRYLVQTVETAFQINPNISFELFIHKVDGDAFPLEEHKVDAQRNTRQKLTQQLHEANLNVRLTFHLTSIYDHSIFEAFSKVYHKLLPQFPFVENLLNSLITNCKIVKAFLFDVVSKVYIGTDHNPVELQTYEICSDMIDVVVDVSCIYGVKDKTDSLAFDSNSGAVITLNNGHVLFLRQVGRYLALVCLLQEESFSKAALVEYNLTCFKQALNDLCHSINVKQSSSSSSTFRQSTDSSFVSHPSIEATSNTRNNITTH